MSAAAPDLWRGVERALSRRRRRRRQDVWTAVRAHIDPALYHPKLMGDVEIKVFRLRWGNDYAMIANPRDLLHYQIQLDDLETIRLMDGTRTVKEIVLERFRETGDLELGGVGDLVRQLREGGFLAPPFVDVHAAIEHARQPSVLRRKVRRFLEKLDIEWSGADRVVRWFHDHGLRHLFHPPVVIGMLAIGLVGLVAFGSLVRSGRFSISTQSSLALEFVILGSLNYFLTFAHEMGHALTLVHQGRRIKSAGFMIYYGSPAFFVDSSDGLMSERRDRIRQAAAGPFAELILAGGASMIALAFPDFVLSPTLYKFAVLNYFILFMNLVPMLELDGYFILADVIQVPDLRPRALSFVRHDLWHKLRNRERLSGSEAGLALYGILGVGFALFSLYAGFFFWRAIFGKLIARMWGGGPASRTLLVVLALLVAGPIVRAVIDGARALTRRASAAARKMRFRFETGWRVEAAELIDQLPLFDDVPVEVLNEVAGRVRLRTAADGEPIVRQGERADAFYVVRRGTLHVVEEDPETGRARVLRTLGRGETFGELGLLEGAPRAATVRAASETELFVLDKGAFEQLLADMAHIPEFEPTLEAIQELRELPAFAHLEPDELSGILENGEWVNISPGERVVRQGEVGDAFYAVRSGQLAVLKDGAETKRLGPGSYFGEIGLLLDVPRMATVRALTPVRAFRLERDGFDRLVRESFLTGTLDPHIQVRRTGLH